MKEENRLGEKLPAFNSPKNWVEDYNDGHNQYVCSCVVCKERFYGYKRRVVCKECYSFASPPEPVKEERYCVDCSYYKGCESLMDVHPKDGCKLFEPTKPDPIQEIEQIELEVRYSEGYDFGKEFTIQEIDKMIGGATNCYAIEALEELKTRLK